MDKEMFSKFAEHSHSRVGCKTTAENVKEIARFGFSNLSLNGSTLRYSLRKPLDKFTNLSTCQEWCTLTDVLRTDFRQEVKGFYSLVSPDMKETLEKEVEILDMALVGRLQKIAA